MHLKLCSSLNRCHRPTLFSMLLCLQLPALLYDTAMTGVAAAAASLALRSRHLLAWKIWKKPPCSFLSTLL